LARTRVLEEALVPASRTADWLKRIGKLEADFGKVIFDDAVEGLSLLEAKSDAEEALSIALILREALEDKSKTAALVTPDQALARRVRARLARWDVEVDMSQGEPLAETNVGVFLEAVLDISQNSDSALAKAILFGHELTSLGQKRDEVLSAWQLIEHHVYRTERPDQKPERAIEETLLEALAPLVELGGLGVAPVWASALIVAAERIATHPRLSILGPLEARMLEADVIVLGGLNEGTWPAAPSPGPFLSRGMRRDMKLSLPERRYGLAAHDFFELASNPVVFLTRSKRSDSGPTIASRWVWRLQTLLQGAVGEAGLTQGLTPQNDYLGWARALDYVPSNKVEPAKPPQPKPPVEKRWTTKKGRNLSITEVKTFIRDPYSIYGKHVLGLKKLNDLDQAHGPAEFGSAVHKGIENFLKTHKAPLTEVQDAALVACLGAAMAEFGYREEVIAKERARFKVIAKGLREELNKRASDSFEQVGLEVWGEASIPDRNFSVRGQMDYVERGIEGYGFVDFKTGTPAADTEVAAGFDPQLPLAAFIAREGGLKRQEAGQTVRLGYIQVKGTNNGFKHFPIGKKKPIDDLVNESIETLQKLIDKYDDAATPYESQVRSKFTNSYSDFDDLARRGEWAGLSGGDADG